MAKGYILLLSGISLLIVRQGDKAIWRQGEGFVARLGACVGDTLQ